MKKIRFNKDEKEFSSIISLISIIFFIPLFLFFVGSNYNVFALLIPSIGASIMFFLISLQGFENTKKTVAIIFSLIPLYISLLIILLINFNYSILLNLSILISSYIVMETIFWVIPDKTNKVGTKLLIYVIIKKLLIFISLLFLILTSDSLIKFYNYIKPYLNMSYLSPYLIKLMNIFKWLIALIIIIGILYIIIRINALKYKR